MGVWIYLRKLLTLTSLNCDYLRLGSKKSRQIERMGTDADVTRPSIFLPTITRLYLFRPFVNVIRTSYLNFNLLHTRIYVYVYVRRRTHIDDFASSKTTHDAMS